MSSFAAAQKREAKPKGSPCLIRLWRLPLKWRRGASGVYKLWPQKLIPRGKTFSWKFVKLFCGNPQLISRNCCKSAKPMQAMQRSHDLAACDVPNCACSRRTRNERTDLHHSRNLIARFEVAKPTFFETKAF